MRDWLAAYGYREIRMPILEQTGLFKRAIGEVTDIVEKEMYTFVDELNGESLTLRPEGTASCVRAVIQHNLLYDGGKRLWYAGPMFRHERPQKGRYRQFHQIGVEALRLCRAGRRCRTHPDVRATCGGASASRPTLQTQHAGRRGRSRQRHRRTADRVFRGAIWTRWMRMPGGVCTAIRCAFWTARIRPCRRWWKRRPG